jgi:signal transduction histidine kinase
MLRLMKKGVPLFSAVARGEKHLISSLRFRLMLLVILAVLPALVLTLATGLESRRIAAEAVGQEAIRLARLAAGNEEALIEGAQQLLMALAQLPEVTGDDPGACRVFLANLVAQYANYSALSVARPNGDVTCSSGTVSNPVNISDRDYFVQVLEERAFIVGDYVFGRVSRKPVLPFAYPVIDASGQVRAVLVASLDLAWLNRLASEIRLPEQSAIRVMDGKGTILARLPDPEGWVGKQLPGDALLERIRSLGGEGTAEAPGLDGVERLYAFTPLRGSTGNRIYLSLGIPTEVAYAEVNRRLAQNLIALGLVAVLAMVAAWFTGDLFILRQVRMLVSATRRLAEGEPGARSGIDYSLGELGRLAAAFDQMAATLEERQAQLKRSNRELQDFAYIASHDLQEPLRKIQAFGERLETRYAQALGEEGRQYVERMSNDAARMQTMINDLLAYSRVNTRGRAFEPVDLGKVVQEAISDLQIRIEETGARIEIGELPVVEGDALQLHQLFQNLIGNSIKFHKPDEPPVVQVTARKPERGASQVEIIVEDDGIGFDEKYLDRIFDPFQRLHGRGVYEGSGIGLSICRKIVERHGGGITAKSKPGVGAAFHVTLPVKQPSGRLGELAAERNGNQNPQSSGESKSGVSSVMIRRGQ